MLTPDFGSSAFPLRSANNNIIPLDASLTRCKKVKFARKLTEEYEIAPRRCKRRLSTSTEQVRNKVLRLQRQLQFERETMDLQAQLEAQLFHQKNAHILKHTDAITNLELQNLKSCLELKQQEFEDEIFSMRMDILRIKGLCQKLVAEMKEQNKTIEKKESTIPSCFGVQFAQTLWSIAVLNPTPLFEGSWAA